VSWASDHPVLCVRAADGCTASHPNSRHDAIRAGEAGWFHSQQEHVAYCPAHVPAWVAGWRAKKAAKKFEVSGSFTRLPMTSQCDGCEFTETEDSGSEEDEKSLRARAFAHAEQTGHTVSVGHASVLVIEPVGETVSG
jgi:hypothetical protein